jgi:membrane-associated phospholipid phosphatase
MSGKVIIKNFIITAVLLHFFAMAGQQPVTAITDTIAITDTVATTYTVASTDTIVKKLKTNNYQFSYKQLIVPGAFIGYGAIGLNSVWIKSVNRNIRNGVSPDIDRRITIDDFSRYAPALSVYALNVAGIHGKHNFKDRTIILFTSLILVNVTVAGLKQVVHVRRPDGTSNDSFPSGHTTSAFAGAEFLWQEYKDTSVWYGIAGYAVATGTGLFRIYNDRHWFTDVAAGAGIGILGTKAAYWLHPFIQNKIFGKKETKVSALIMPFYNGQQYGCVCTMQF